MTIKTLPIDKKIILFDAVCTLCNASVQFIIKRDKKDLFRFVSLQSELGKAVLNHIDLSLLSVDTIVLYESEKTYYSKASAVIRIVMSLGGLYKMFYLFTFLPKFITDGIYDYIARNRYQWYGKQERCMLPTQEITSKFLA